MTRPIALMRNALRPKRQPEPPRLVPDQRPEMWDGVGDGRLLTEIAAGDIDALGELYDRHGPHCWEVARRLSADAETATEAVMVTFVELWKQAPGLADEMVLTGLTAATTRAARSSACS